MFFDTLALMFAGMSFSVMGNSVPNNAFTRTDLYGGSLIEYSYDLNGVDSEDFLNSVNLISCDLTGEETHLVDNNVVVESKTYVNYFRISAHQEFHPDDDVYDIYFALYDFYALRVSPSLFVQLDINHGERVYTSKTLSSYNDTIDEDWYYSLSSRYFDCTIRLYLVYTNDPSYDLMFEESNYYQGYEQGYNTGNQTGYTTGYTDGYNTGNTDGYTSGFQNGSASGYQDGYTDALETHSFTFTNLFGSIADTPILIIRRLFGFELFGVGLIGVFMSLFTALIVIHLIKKVF